MKNSQKEYGKSLLQQILARPIIDRTTGSFRIEYFNKLYQEYRNHTKKEAAEYRRLMAASRWQRFKNLWQTVGIDWARPAFTLKGRTGRTYYAFRKSSLLCRILLFFTVKRKI